MALTAFSSRFGQSQGRLPEPGAAEGNFVFVLGDFDGGHYAELNPGDYAKVTQTTDLTGISLLRVALDLGIPKSTPTGFGWRAVLLVDGVVYGATSAASGRVRAITDLAANVSKLDGLHEIAVRLELITT
jgi:hypothetical protein